MRERELPPDDIEVGRYALRSFRLNTQDKHLCAIQPLNFCGDFWKGGVCEADCLASSQEKYKLLRQLYLASHVPLPPELQRDFHGHKAPKMECRCGIYGALSMRRLYDFATREMGELVVVIAAEGSTIIGDYGLRTSAARIVAFWATNPEWVSAVSKECNGEARHFTNLDEMLSTYNLPWGSAPSTVTNWAHVYPVRNLPRKHRTKGRISRVWAALWLFFLVAMTISDAEGIWKYGNAHQWWWVVLYVVLTMAMAFCSVSALKRVLRR